MSFLDSDLEFEGDLQTLNGVLQEFGQELTDELIESLHKKVRGFTSKKLEQSIRFTVEKSGPGYRFQLFFEQHGLFIDEGVQGTGEGGWSNAAPSSPFKFKKGIDNKPSWRHFRDWSATKGLNPHAVSQAVWRKGIRPNYWFTEVVDRDLAKMLASKLEKVSAKNIEIDLTNILKGSVNAK